MMSSETDFRNAALQYSVKKLQKNGELNHDKRISQRRTEIPFWEKYTLSIEEAAEYFRIGHRRLRQMVADDPNADFILMNGNRVQIKRKLFEEYINEATVV